MYKVVGGINGLLVYTRDCNDLARVRLSGAVGSVKALAILVHAAWAKYRAQSGAKRSRIFFFSPNQACYWVHMPHHHGALYLPREDAVELSLWLEKLGWVAYE